MAAFVRGSGYAHQIRHKDAPIDPALETSGSVGRATPEWDGALHHADATCDSVAKAQTFLEPVLLFRGGALRHARSRLWDRDLFNAQASSQVFIVWREKARSPLAHAADAQSVGNAGAAKAATSPRPEDCLGDNLQVADQAMFDFGVVDLVSEPGFVRLRFATADDLRVRLSWTGDFICAGTVSLCRSRRRA